MGQLKSSRVQNVEILAEVRKRPCQVCNRRGVDAHHIKTKGSGGPDSEWNLLPLCRIHHSEVHQSGLDRFTQKYPQVKMMMIAMGWMFSSDEGIFHPSMWP